MDNLSTEVLIVGAGPTGLMLACDLHRRNVPFRIIDRAESPSNRSRAVCLQARTLEAIDDFGILDAFFNRGLVVEGVATYRERVLEERFGLETTPSPELPFPYLLVLEQHVTESILLNHLLKHGVAIERNTELHRMTSEMDQVKSQLRTPAGDVHLRSSYIVGCDGSHSSVRSLAGITMNAVSAPVIYRCADVELQWDLSPTEIHRFPNENFEFLAIPLPGQNRYRLNLWESANEPLDNEEISFGALDTPPQPESMDTLLQELAPKSISGLKARYLTSYRTGQGVSEQFSKGRVFLAGDSAHLIPQCTSQGLNLGLQDVYNLGWKLGLVVHGDAPQELLESYDAERRKVALNLIKQSKPNAPVIGRALQFESREALDEWSHLNLKYPESPLNYCTATNGSVRAGSRAPDGLLASDGCLSHLYEIMTGSSHHLLAFCDQDDEQLVELLDEIRQLYDPMVRIHHIGLSFPANTDVDRRLHRAYGASHGDLILVRPDRFIGARGTLKSPEQFRTHLAQLFIPRLGIDAGELAEV